MFSIAGLPLITLSRTASAWMEIPPILALSIESVAEEFGAEKSEKSESFGFEGFESNGTTVEQGLSNKCMSWKPLRVWRL